MYISSNLSLCQELDRFKKAMEDPQFRDLLKEYTDEISDPRNRAEHEAYLAEVEERARHDPQAQDGDYSGVAGAASIPKGMKLVSPTPVFCLKIVVPANAPRKVKEPNPSLIAQKIFVNVCTCDAMDDVSSQKVKDVNGNKSKTPVAGEQFSLPYSLAGPRDTKDTRGASAKVYDFVFSESTWNQYRAHLRIVHMFQEMAIDAIEEKEGLEVGAIDKKEVIILKNTTFKGQKPPPRLFKVSDDKWKEMKEKNAAKAAAENATKPSAASSTPASASGSSKSASDSSLPADMKQVSSKSISHVDTPKADPRTTPSYTIVHRGYYDMSVGQMAVSGESTNIDGLFKDRPKELILKIELPLLEKVSEVNLDQSVRQVLLTSIGYYLLAPLPYPVLADAGVAKWSSKLKQLTVTMTVDKPSQDEIERYQSQRHEFDKRQHAKAEEEKRQREEEEKEEEARKEREAKEQQEAAAAEEAARIARESAAASAAAAAVAVTSSPKAPSPSSGPVSVLKSSLHSPGSSPSVGPSGEERHVRFSFTDTERSAGIPERDGPNGPKPVGKIVSDDASHGGACASQKKGHKKKHVPGAEGPEAWTGVGIEPAKEIQAHFPNNTGANQTNGGKGKNDQVHWPSYTYSQSPVSVVMVLKVKSISSDTVRLNMTDSIDPTSDTTRSHVDLTFSTTSPKRNYRLFLPLAYAIQIPKSSYEVTSKNLILNLIKVTAPVGQKQEWSHLLDYSVLGEFDTEGTPISSPAASPIVRPGDIGSAMAELSLGLAHHQQQTEATDAIATDSRPTPAPTAAPPQPLEMIKIDQSKMINPFIQAAATTTKDAQVAAAPTFVAPNQSLLFQLD